MGVENKIRKKKIRKPLDRSLAISSKSKAQIQQNVGLLNRIKNILSHFNNDSDKSWAIQKLKSLGLFNHVNNLLELQTDHYSPAQSQIINLIKTGLSFTKYGWLQEPLKYAFKFLTNTFFDYKKSNENPQVTYNDIMAYQNQDVPQHDMEIYANNIFMEKHLKKIFAILKSKRSKLYKEYIVSKYLKRLQNKQVPSFIIDKIKSQMIIFF